MVRQHPGARKMLNLECRILDVECTKFGRQSLRNSEPASAGDISIAMGWSSTVRVGVDRKADEAPQSGETPRTNKKYFGTRGMGDRSLGCNDKQRFPVSGLAPFRQR